MRPISLSWKEKYVLLHKKMKFSIKDFFSKCDQILRKLRIWSQLLKKPLIKNLIKNQKLVSSLEISK